MTMFGIGTYIAPFKPVQNVTPFTHRDGATYLEVLEGIRAYVNDTLVEFINDNVSGLGDKFEVEVTRLILEVNTMLDGQTADNETKIQTLTTSVDSALQTVATSLGDHTIEIDGKITTLEASVSGSITTLESFVNGEVSGLTAYVDAQVAAMVGAEATINDSVITAIVNDTGSGTRTALDAIYSGTQFNDTAVSDLVANPATSTRAELDTLYGGSLDDAGIAGLINTVGSDTRVAGDAVFAGKSVEQEITGRLSEATLNETYQKEHGGVYPVTTLPISSRKKKLPTLDIAGTMPENIIKVGSTYWMLYTDVNIALCVAFSSSPKGPWTPHGTPILTTGSLAWETIFANGGSLVESGGTFYLFYATDTFEGNGGSIGVATAASVTGPYTKNATPILSVGVAGSWDSLRVQEPDVILVDGVWTMAYMAETTAQPKSQSEKIGIATATNPLGPWTKSVNNPVVGFGAVGTWDRGGAADPSLHYEDGIYWMLYSGLFTLGGKPWQLGLAYADSVDGPWIRHQSNPVIPVGEAGSFDAAGVWRGAVFVENDIHHVTYGGIPVASSSAAKAGYAELYVPPISVWRNSNDGRDTGWITIVPEGTVTNMPKLSIQIRRQGDVVNVAVAESAAGARAGVIGTVWAMLPGFTPHTWAISPLVDTTGEMLTVCNMAVTPTGINMWVANGRRHYGTASYLTNDPWPEV